MPYGDLPEDGVSVVGHDNASHGVHEHLEHGLGPKARPDDVADGPGRRDVLLLDLLALVALGVAAQHQDGGGAAAAHAHHTHRHAADTGGEGHKGGLRGLAFILGVECRCSENRGSDSRKEVNSRIASQNGEAGEAGF